MDNTKKFLSFELNEKNYKIHKILEQDFMEISLTMIADHEPNNNMSHFTLESMKDAIPTIYNKPILGAYYKFDDEQDGDFIAHSSELEYDEDTETPYFDNSGPYQEVPLGLITESSKVEIIKGEDGANWIRANGFIWVQYATKQVLTLLRKRKGHCKVSVEVEVLDSETDEKTGIEHIKKFKFLGVTILGSIPNKNAALMGLEDKRMEVHEGIEGANLKVLNFSQNPKFQERLHKLTMAYEQFEKNMNFKNSDNQNQNEENKISDEGKTDLAVEGQDIYHPHPQNPENEDIPIIGYDDENAENKDNTDNKDTESERKEKKFSMLTYNMKRQLLDSALSECIANNYGTDRGYGWIQDFTDAECYFYLDCTGEEDGTYVAPYTITMTTENGEEKVDNCVIDFAQKERAIQTWHKMSEEDSKGTEKTDMKKNKFANNDVVQNPEANGITIPEHFDDRGTEAPHSGDDRGKAAPKSGDDRGTPKTGTHENHAAEDQDENKDTKENEACEDKQEESCNKENEAKEVTEVKSKSAGGDKEVTEVKSKSTNAEDDSKEDSKDDSKNTDKEKSNKETEDCDCDDNKDGSKEEESCKDTEKECNYEAKFAQLSADYVTIQKENETLKSVNAKFEADIADLMKKVESFESEAKARHNNDMYTFGINMIDAEVDLAEDCRKNMSAELKTECNAGKFASEDEVKKFTVTKIAMALYEARQNGKANTNNANNSNVSKNSAKVNNEKQEFVQNIAKPTPQVDALTASRMALEKLDDEE